ncbi:GDP-mannose mannosyl hydrolase [Diplonema papillatum]|nr:GDP-mannose mannosyl hydrolase [Diplonema papillatum]
MSCPVTPFACGLVAGVSVGFCLWGRRRAAVPDRKPITEKNALTPDPRRILSEDDTLLYGAKAGLTEVKEGARMLPREIYQEVVRRMPVVCVDVVMRDRSKSRILIVQRGMEPVKGYWWLPGGRMLKGETFYAAAVRKAAQETGLSCVPVKHLGVYNTIFPTSAWDGEMKGTQTVNAVVLVDIESADVVLDDTSDKHQWISTDHKEAEEAGFDRYIVEQLRRIE